MRRIRSRCDVARSKRNRNILIGVFMILLLVVAPIGYSLFSRDNGSVDENVANELGVDFFREGGYWKIVIDESVFGFQYLPSEVDYVSINGTYDFKDYVGEILYFVGANEGASEVLNNLGDYVLRYQEACIDNSSCVGDLPLKDCGSNLIIFEVGTPQQVPSMEGNDTMVWKNDGCIYIVGDSVRGADAFLYKALKIT